MTDTLNSGVPPGLVAGPYEVIDPAPDGVITHPEQPPMDDAASAMPERAMALRRSGLDILDSKKLIQIAGFDDNYPHRHRRQ